MPESSRKGRRIASKACDLCRERKVQCLFDNENAESCQKCVKSGVPCTFFTDRKPRGPPSRRVAEAKKRAQQASILHDAATPGYVAPGPPPPPAQKALPNIYQPLPLARITVEHLVPERIFINIITDFLDRVYPVLPLVHLPTFEAKFQARAYETDPAFFRLCVAITTVTAASIPRQIDTYGCHMYRDVGELAEKASHMILMSRMESEPSWQNSASRESMIVSVIMSMASHYAGRVNMGWFYASEAIQFFRSLELYGKAAYAGLNPIDAEMCKRSFWILYIVQIHDRLGFTNPHTGLSYDAVNTDWEFLVPAEVRDEHLQTEAPLLPPPLPSSSHGTGPSRPLISGFIALIKVFLCIGDVISKAFPGPPPSYALSAGPLNTRFLPEQLSSQSPPSHLFTTPSLETLFKVIRRLHTTLNDLPDELKLPQRTNVPPTPTSVTGAAGPSPLPGLPSPQEHPEPIFHPHTGTGLGTGLIGESSTGPPPLPAPPVDKIARQFEIMRVNIHVTSLYFQSTLLELCLNALQQQQQQQQSQGRSLSFSSGSTPTALTAPAATTIGITSPSSAAGAVSPDVARDMAGESAARIQLWEFRENLARELLNVVTSSSQETLEANGHSMIVKIREIAASLLDKDVDPEIGSDIEDRNRQYVARFVDILAKLDYASRNLRGT